MKVLLVNGSPHKNGCTYTALCEVSSALNENGISTDIFWIGNKPISGCIACRKCQEKNKCILDDSASGNTKDVAEKIAKITEADLFEIEPVEPYTDDDLDWTDDDSRVSREHDDESLRDVELVSTTVDNWDSYDTVYIGYPIWWGIAAWPVDNFVKENDFTGKTVIPFCTAATSGIGDSGNLLEEMTGTGDWKEGERFHGGASESDISSWIDSLGL